MLLSYFKANRIEAGRGCLAGSAFAAIAILPPDLNNNNLNHSKQQSEKIYYD